MPPEMLNCLVHDNKSDIWMLGCLFYELIVGKHPYSGETYLDFIIKMKQGKYNIPSNTFSVQSLDLLTKCL